MAERKVGDETGEKRVMVLTIRAGCKQMVPARLGPVQGYIVARVASRSSLPNPCSCAVMRLHQSVSGTASAKGSGSEARPGHSRYPLRNAIQYLVRPV